MIDLNVDAGEGGAHDEALLALATSANLACGGHAGGGAVLEVAIARAVAAGVAIGAHPGYPDRRNFGRAELGEPVKAVIDEARWQLDRFCEVLGGIPHHVKPHGALYHRLDRDGELAEAFCNVMMEWMPKTMIYAFSNGGLARIALDFGLPVRREGFVDRNYGDDGWLLPRDHPNAMIDDIHVAVAQAVRLVESGHVDTLCVHGDGAGAVALLTAVRRALLHE